MNSDNSNCDISQSDYESSNNTESDISDSNQTDTTDTDSDSESDDNEINICYLFFILYLIINFLVEQVCNIEIELECLNDSYWADISGILELITPKIIKDYDAEASINIDINLFNNLFFISSDSSDISNTDSSYGLDICFEMIKREYIDNIFSNNLINPFLSLVDLEDQIDSQIDPSNCDIPKDFIRYLSLKLFNTPRAVDLFSNESELYNSLISKGVDWNNNLVDKLYDNYQNISREIYASLTYSEEGRYRFRNLMENQIDLFSIENILQNRTAYDILDGRILFPLPFIKGDCITFKITIYPAENQHNLTGVEEIKERVYKINLHLI